MKKTAPVILTFLLCALINNSYAVNHHIKRECTHTECTHTTESSNLARHVVNKHNGVCGKDGCTVQFNSGDKKQDAKDLSAHWKDAHNFLERAGYSKGKGAEDQRRQDKSNVRIKNQMNVNRFDNPA